MIYDFMCDDVYVPMKINELAIVLEVKREERTQLEQEYKDIQTELSPLRADAKKLWAIHYNIYEVQHEQERRNAATRQKRQEIER